MCEKEVSPEDRIKVHELCKSQLGGKWAEVKESELIIRPVPNGMVNKLFFCFLPEHIQSKHNRVVVRYTKYVEGSYFVNETHVIAISLILSERKLSPKILSTFHNGTISQYIKCRYFDASDDLNDKSVELLAQKLAKFHSSEAPIPKNSVKMSLDLIFVKWFTKEIRDSYSEGKVRQLIEKHKHPLLSKLNFLDEIDWLRKTMENLNSPIVLSHNDLNRRNILIQEENNTQEIFIIDFDWSCNTYRGVDLGQYFACWCQKELDFGYIVFPSDQQMSVFIDAYIKAMTKIYGTSFAEQEINSRERLIKEAKVFALFAWVKEIICCLWMAEENKEKVYLPKGEERFRCYDELKTRILEEYK